MDKIYKVIDGNDVTVYNYYENDKLSSVTVPGGTTTSYTYDEEGNLLTLTNKKSDGTVLDSFTYTYSDDTLGVKNQISKTETVGGVLKGTTSYEYDGLGRLTKTVTPDGVQNVYTYDGAGNRLTKTSTAGEESAVTEYTYDEQNRLLNTSAYVTGGTDEVNTYYGYDNNGNQISRWTQTEKTSGTEDAVTLSELGINAADETAVYEYDVFNRLTAIYQGDTIIENTYDGAGDNISRVEDGVSVYYVYDGNTVILELDGNGAEKARNVYGRNLIARESDGEKAIYRYNGHGDVIALNAPNGDMIAEYAYDEFGQVIEEQAAPQATPMVDIDFSVEGSEEYDFPEDSIFDNPYRYAGYEYLDEVELYDLNARYYDPSIARFLTEDPYYNLGNRVMGVYEINVPNVYSIMQANALYAYCGNNPVIYYDPNGKFLIAIILGFLAVTTVAGAILGGVTAYQNGARGWDLVKGIVLGGALGLAAGGAIIATGAVVFGAIFGISATFLGVTALQAFAIGALAFNFTALIIAPLFGLEMQSIEFEIPSKDTNYYQTPSYTYNFLPFLQGNMFGLIIHNLNKKGVKSDAGFFRRFIPKL